MDDIESYDRQFDIKHIERNNEEDFDFAAKTFK